MALPKPREGTVVNNAFRTQPNYSEQTTLADAETIIWSSINQLCAYDIANSTLIRYHLISSKRRRDKIARNLGIYIRQAHEFYEAGKNTNTRTSPLFYYYSFLNIAKALGSIYYPDFHKRVENYRHGISWRSDPNYVVRPWRDSVNITSARGVWHILWEITTGRRFQAKKNIQFRVRDLFALCPEISIEYERSFMGIPRLIHLINPCVCVDERKREAWIAASVPSYLLKRLGISREQFAKTLSYRGKKFRAVRSDNKADWRFELIKPVIYRKPRSFYNVFEKELVALNLYTSIESEGITYMVPDLRGLPRRIPQSVAIYSLFYYLGSMVRYDPHSVDSLSESRWWVLIDGFINQSRIWLLELLEWYLYRKETCLRNAR